MKDPRPPEEGGAGAGESVSRQLDCTQDTATASPSDVPAQLRRRRAASWRCNPLQSGRRDPWHDPPTESVTERELASWRAAWRHLRGCGLPAVVPERVVAAGQAHRRDGAP